MRLYWAGHSDYGGWIYVERDEVDAIRRAHGEFCECGAAVCDGWRAADVAEQIGDRWRLAVTERAKDAAPLLFGAMRLWWLRWDETGEFVVAESADEAAESWRMEHDDLMDEGGPEYVDEIARVGGFDVRVVEAGA